MDVYFFKYCYPAIGDTGPHTCILSPHPCMHKHTLSSWVTLNRESLCCCFEAFSFSTSLSFMNEYLAIDSGGNAGEVFVQ